MSFSVYFSKPSSIFFIHFLLLVTLISSSSSSSSSSSFSSSSTSSSASSFTAPSSGSLRFMAITNADNDQDQLASIAEINPTNGALTLHGNFTFAVTAAGLDCTTAYAGASTVAPYVDPLTNTSTTVYYAITGNGPNIDTIDAVTGKVLSSVLTEVAYVIIGIAYDPQSSTLKGIGGTASGRTVQYLDINITAGTIKVIQDGLPLPFPTPCEAALSLSTSRYYTLTQTKPNDDAPEELVTIDLTKGTILSTISLDTINKEFGILNSLITLPAHTLSSNETIVSWVIDHNFRHSPHLIWIDPMTGLYSNLTALPDTGAYKDCTVPLAASSLLYTDPVSGNITIGSIIFNNAVDETYLAMVTIQPTAPRSPYLTMVDILEKGKEYAPIVTLDLVKVHAEGTQLIWAPAWVVPPAY